MFTIYHSNQLDILSMLIAELIKGRLIRDPFQPEIILTQSSGMAKWIQMSLASQLSIAANIECLLPSNFIWKMLMCTLPNVPTENVFLKTTITWKLVELLPKLCNRTEFKIIKRYLHDDINGRKCFQFATQVAELFDKYLIFRPDWLEHWSCGELIDGLDKAQYWQAPLWKILIEEIEQIGAFLWNRSNLYQLFIDHLKQYKIRLPTLPDRVFICGISILPPIYLKILQALGRHIDIHFLFTNPSRYYWGDIQEQSFLTQLLHRYHHKRFQKNINQPSSFKQSQQIKELFDKNKDEQHIVGHSLLSSWGKQGRDNLYLLTKMEDFREIDAFVEPNNEFLLGKIQHDILDLEDRAVIGLHQLILEHSKCKRLLQPSDRSISIHVCHSLQREVEVLHDSLLAMMVQDSTLRAQDIIVMIADIDLYTPVIQAVFSNDTDQFFLPFVISDRKIKNIHPIMTTLLSLLGLPHSRCTAEQILRFLEVPEIAARFSIKDKELQLLLRWVKESGIRWGLDDNTSHELMLPITGQHTWQFGLRRMLLGYAMDSYSGGAWKGILPYDDISDSMANLVGHLADFLTQLQYWRSKLTSPRTLNAWLTCLHHMIDDFCILDATAQSELSVLEIHWQQIIQCGLDIGYNQLVPITLLRDELEVWLDQERNTQEFLDGAVNFCTFIPMRSIPHRIICLLGMNDGVYPRTFLPSGFDLMIHHPRCGDRNQNDDDRYLFLEALLSAQQRLYVSFIGCSIQDNTLCYPSVLISELCDYIAQSFYLPGDEHVDSGVSADHILEHLWQWHTRMPFELENFLPDSEFQSFAHEWLPTKNEKKIPYSNFISPLTSRCCKKLSFNDLYHFYRHPIRAWFQQRLAISFCQTISEHISDEPFSINYAIHHQIKNRLLHSLIKNQNAEQLFHQFRTAGLLPYGAFGEIYWMKQYQKMKPLAEKVIIHQQPIKNNLEIYLTLDDVTLTGWLSQVQVNGLLRWHPRRLSAQDALLLWLEHLTYCAIGEKGESRMFGTFGEWHFPFISSENAKIFLSSLIAGYRQGMTVPLMLLSPFCEMWVIHCFKIKKKCIDWGDVQQQVKNKILQKWQSNDYYPKQSSEDPYVQRIIHNLDNQHIQEIISAAKNFLLPPFCFNIAQNKISKYDIQAILKDN